MITLDSMCLPDLAAPPTDGILVAKAISGSRSAFDELVIRYQQRAIAVAFRLLRNGHDALEISQEAFLKAYTNLKKLQQPESFGPWLLRIVSNLSLNLRRSRKSPVALPLDDFLPVSPRIEFAEPSRQLQSVELGVQIENALAHLTARQRTAVTLFAGEKIPQKQIAETLGCTTQAAKWHVFQGRRKLRELLENCV